MPPDLILYALVAAGLIFWLRSVLGSRSGGERQRPNPFTTPPPGPPLKPPGAGQQDLTPGELALSGALTLPKGGIFKIAGPDVEAGLQAIGKTDHGFQLDHFLEGAQDAFVMIVEAFARGDRETLKSLLMPDLFKAFDGAVKTREESGETLSAEIHAIRRVEVTNAQIQGKMVYITLRFTADETLVTRDRDGNVVSGNPDRVSEKIDLWTFGRPVDAREPTWFLVATREETPDIPDGGATVAP